MNPIRVALADDHPVVLAGVEALLQRAPDIELVGQATGGDEALRLFRELAPDVAVTDISMPGLNGLDLVRRLAAECPQIKLLALTVHEDRAYVEPLLEAGARGYLLKRSAAEDLVRAIRAVAEGGIYLDPVVAGIAIDASATGSAASGGELSERERDVLRLTAAGHSNKEIAARLGISSKTVETYKVRASGKLGLRTRAEIVRYGVEQGWLEQL
jgi:DNA-binding NarL/FixJ family response regulator